MTRWGKQNDKNNSKLVIKIISSYWNYTPTPQDRRMDSWMSHAWKFKVHETQNIFTFTYCRTGKGVTWKTHKLNSPGDDRYTCQGWYQNLTERYQSQYLSHWPPKIQPLLQPLVHIAMFASTDCSNVKNQSRTWEITIESGLLNTVHNSSDH